jgi:hypothetical protein
VCRGSPLADVQTDKGRVVERISQRPGAKGADSKLTSLINFRVLIMTASRGLSFVCVVVVTLSVAAPARAVFVLTENFNNDSQFTKSDFDSAAVFFNDSTGGTDTYWGIWDQTGATDNFGSDTPPADVRVPDYTGFTGNHLVAEFEVAGPNTPPPMRLDWTSLLPITDLTGLTFTGRFAADGGVGEVFESTDAAGTDGDFIRVQYRIDGGAYQPLLYFAGDVNGFMARDTDFDGVGDSTILSNASLPFTVPIVGMGMDLDLRVLMWTNASAEQIGMDTFAIEGVPEPSAFLFGGLVCGVIGLRYAGRRMFSTKTENPAATGNE